jgi:NAD(P)-dependent dehydrogenase (short-subunit alcohol dehydrogenase family)
MGLLGWTRRDVPALCGKTALVTGANSGIGFELTRSLVEHGCEGERFGLRAHAARPPR